MKFKSLACAMLVIMGMVSCTAESDAIVNEVETTVSLEKSFNARSVEYQNGKKNELNLGDLIPVSTDEAISILNMLREKKGLTESCSVTTKEGETNQSFLTIHAEQCVNSCYNLALQLQMISYADDNSLYYKDSEVSANSSQFLWHKTGFGLSSNGADGMFKFECTSYLYFKVVEDGIKYMQVPVKVNGDYNPKTHEVSFDYSI